MLDCRVLETNKFFLKLKECEQNPKWHSEGNAFNHTLMVYNAMVEKLKDDTYYDDYKKDILLNAALYHDIGKSVTTKWSNEKNSWTSPYHAIEGEKLTRFILWNEDFRWREKVCSLVRNHMKPLNMFEGNRTDEFLQFHLLP